MDMSMAASMAASQSSEHPLRSAVADHTLRKADTSLLEHRYGEAFFNYLLVLRLTPARKAEVKENFTFALREWGDQCEREGKFEELMASYQQAYEVFPECETVVSNMGAQLFRLGYVDEAASYFRKALRLNPSFLQAQENLENVFSHLVERWHFRMLNDKQRNEAYKHAITQAVKQGKSSVLDIGTGTGLLAMFAAEAGAKRVFGCEMSRTMYEMSHDVIAANHMAHQIQLIHKKSTDLVIGADLPQKVDLLVTETFDGGLLGEHILETLHHAWTHLAHVPPTTQVIPCGATVYVCAVECAALRQQHRLLYEGIRYLDLSSTTILSKAGALEGFHTDAEDNWTSDGLEPYTTERLADLHGGYKVLSEVHPVHEMDFTNLELLQEYMNGYSKHITLPICHGGRLDALVMWFDLHLDPTLTLSSAPEAKSCWEQAVFPVHPLHVAEWGQQKQENLAVRPNDSLLVSCQCQENAFVFRCREIQREKLCGSLHSDDTGLTDSQTEQKPADADDACTCSCDNEPQREQNDLTQPNASSGTLQPQEAEKCSSCSKTGGGFYSLSNILAGSFDNMTLQTGSKAGCIQRLAQEDDTCTGETAPYAGVEFSTEGCITFCNTDENRNHDSTDEDTHVHSEFAKAMFLPESSESEFSSGEMSPICTSLHANTDSCHLNSTEILCINDLDFNLAWCKAIEKLLPTLARNKLSCTLIDITQGFSLLPLQAVKLGVERVAVFNQNPINQDLLLKIAKANGIDSDQLSIMSEAETLETMAHSIGQEHVGEAGLVERLTGDWAGLLTELVEPCGCLRQQVLEDIALARMACMASTGRVVPSVVTVYGLLVESESLWRDSAVESTDVTLGLKVADFINDFQMTTHMDITLSTLEYKKLSQPFELLSVDLNQPLDTTDDLQEFLQQSQEFCITCTEAGRVHATVYWFDMSLVEGVRVCTLSPALHWKQAAVMRKDEMVVSTGSRVEVKATLRNSCIGINLNVA